jgi:hypothetical protein
MRPCAASARPRLLRTSALRGDFAAVSRQIDSSVL